MIQRYSISLWMFLLFCPFIKGQNNSTPNNKSIEKIYQSTYIAKISNGVIGKGALLKEKTDTIYTTYNVNSSKTVATYYLKPDTTIYYYNKKGLCEKQITYYPNKKIKESQTYLYNNDDLIKTAIIRNTSTNTIDVISYGYNELNQLSSKISKRWGDESETFERYVYDGYGNWIIKIISENNIPLYYIERIIVYSTQ